MDINKYNRIIELLELLYTVSGGGGGGPTSNVTVTNVPLPVTATNAFNLEATQQLVLTRLTDILSSLQDFNETIWTDDTQTFFLRRTVLDEQTGVFTITYTLPDGSAYIPSTGLRPASSNEDIELSQSRFIATANGTGYSIGDSILQIRFYDTLQSPPVLLSTLYLNETTNLPVSPAPPISDLNPTPSTTISNPFNLEATQQLVLQELQKLIEIEETLLFDLGNANTPFLRRLTLSQTTGAITYTYTNLDGTPYVPVGPFSSSTQQEDHEVEETYFTANTAGVGYAQDDIIKEIILTDHISGTTSTVYRNLTQGTLISPDPTHLSPIDQTTFDLLTQLDQTVNLLYEQAVETCTPANANSVTTPSSVFYSSQVNTFGVSGDTRTTVTITSDSDNTGYTITEPLKISTGQALKVGFATRPVIGSIVETPSNPFRLRIDINPISGVGVTRITFTKDEGLNSGTVSVFGGPTVAVGGFFFSDLYSIYVSGTNLIIEDPTGTPIITTPANANLQDPLTQHTVTYNLLSSLAGTRNQYAFAYSRCTTTTPCSICRNNDLLEEVRDAILNQSNQDIVDAINSQIRQVNDTAVDTSFPPIYLSGGVRNEALSTIADTDGDATYISTTSRGEVYITSEPLEQLLTDIQSGEDCVLIEEPEQTDYTQLYSSAGVILNLTDNIPFSTYTGLQIEVGNLGDVGTTANVGEAYANYRTVHNAHSITFKWNTLNIDGVTALDEVRDPGVNFFIPGYGRLRFITNLSFNGNPTATTTTNNSYIEDVSFNTYPLSAAIAPVDYKDVIIRLEIDYTNQQILVYANTSLVTTLPAPGIVPAQAEVAVFLAQFDSYPNNINSNLSYFFTTESQTCTPTTCTTCDIVNQLEDVNTNLTNLNSTLSSSIDYEVKVTKLIDLTSSAYDIIYKRDYYENNSISSTDYFTIDTTGAITTYTVTGAETFAPFEKSKEAEQQSRQIIQANTTVKTGLVTNYSGVTTLANTSQVVIPSSTTRFYILIQNVSDTDMWVDFGTPATVDNSSILITPGGHLEVSIEAGGFMPTQDITLISTEANKRFIAKQFTI